MIWYKQTTQKLFEQLETNEKGLSHNEVTQRLKEYGPNELAVKRESIWKVIIEPFKSVFVAVLALAAVVSILGHEPLDATIITAIIVVNSVIFYTQQYATTRVLRSLKKHSKQSVTVVRDGKEISVSSVSLVPGDIMVVNEGERIAADARLIHVDSLQINESSLTGESVPVQKHASTLESDKQIYEQDNMIFQGTYALAGTGMALVVETGTRTEFGKIADLASSKQAKSPVQAKIDSLITLMVKAIAVAAIFVFILALVRDIPTNEALRFVMSLSVSAVPEGLPVALTVIIVLGMRRMARKKALVRSFKAIEDVGLVTTIATDKTGTLTKNHLKVVDGWSMGTSDVKSAALLTIDTQSKHTDPLDVAIQESGKVHAGDHVDKVYPFDLKLRMSGAYSQKDKMLYIKGAPEHMIANASLTKEEHHEAESKMHEFASHGYRVIAFGKVPSKASPPDDLSDIKQGDIQLTGFLAFADELRHEATRAIAEAHQAGISVRMITGDHYETAYNIGKQIGLATHPSQVVQGSELPEDLDSLANMIKNKTVFARILPEDKFRILKALKKSEITAMTGDGVNDVPAISNAHVGIAMGSGSDIARDAGGIVLLNDNFATIVKAIAEGRKIFDNIRRMLFYLLSTTLGEIMTMIGALVLGLPLPLTATQILWINLVTDTALVLPLGLEPEEDGHMKRPPRHPNAPMLSRVILSRMVVIGATMAIIALIIVFYLRAEGHSTAYIQTVAFMALIAAQWANAFNARSETQSILSRLKKKNTSIVVGFTIAFILQMIVMFGPLKSAFNIQPVPIATLVGASVIMAIAVLIAGELHKVISRKWFPDKSQFAPRPQ